MTAHDEKLMTQLEKELHNSAQYILTFTQKEELFLIVRMYESEQFEDIRACHEIFLDPL